MGDLGKDDLDIIILSPSIVIISHNGNRKMAGVF